MASVRLWVIFPCYERKNIQPVWKRIYGEWFPGSGYEHSGGVEVEWYSDGDLDADDYLTEIWIKLINCEGNLWINKLK